MIVFNTVVWSIVSTALALSKPFMEDTPIWPNVPASDGAAGVVIMHMIMGWA